MVTYIFGNGNIPFDEFVRYYVPRINAAHEEGSSFIVCDFRGADTLAQEYLKTLTKDVTVMHVADRPRYLVDKYKTNAESWDIVGGFGSDGERDDAAIEACTYFIALDINSYGFRKSGTLKNTEKCMASGKIRIEV